MDAVPASRLRDLQRRYSDPLLSVLTVMLLLLVFVVAPLQAAGVIAFEAFGVVVALFMVVGVLIMSASPVATIVIFAGMLLNVAVIVSRLHRPWVFDLHLVAVAWLIMVGTLGWVVARQVFGPGSITFHRVIGAVLLYLLIAMVFVSLFVFVGIAVPDAFSGLTLEDSPAMASKLIYFSFVTLTSTGYGDIYPVHPVARSLCNLETIIGQLYPATLLARLVTLELERRSKTAA